MSQSDAGRPSPPPSSPAPPPPPPPPASAPAAAEPRRAAEEPTPEAPAPETAPPETAPAEAPKPPGAASPAEGTGPDEAPSPEADERSASLRTDLDEVARARPERAFNGGAALGIVLAVAAAVFVIQNNQATDFEWLWFDFSLPLWTVLVGTLVLGALAMVAAYTIHRRRRRRIVRRREAAGRLREALPEGPEPARRRFPFSRRTARAG